MNIAEEIVGILEANQVKYVFGLPGEEIILLLEAIQQSKKIQFVTVRHEQGAGFMADVYSRITGELGVCLATLGPGATNLMTPAADAYLDFSPVLFLTGQAARHRLYKNSHQVIDTKDMFKPVTKWSELVLSNDNPHEVVQQAIKLAKTHPMGSVHLVIPEDVQAMGCTFCKYQIKVQFPKPTYPNEEQLVRAKEVMASAKAPIIIAGNGIYRERAQEEFRSFVTTLNIPVVETYMGKGSLPNSHPLFVGVLGLAGRDVAYQAIKEADLVITVGYDTVELEPSAWNPTLDKKIIHIGVRPADVDRHYLLEVGIQGQMSVTFNYLKSQMRPFSNQLSVPKYKKLARKDIDRALEEKRFPLSPALVIHELSQLLNEDDVVVSDVGAHKIWIGRLYPSEVPGRCVISNGLAAMGIGVPGGIGAALACPDSRVVTISGDGGFLMNVQELETAMRLKLPIVNIVFRDNLYGLIKWKQHMGRAKAGKALPPQIEKDFNDFDNPDFVKLAESFGARGFRVDRVEDLRSTLKKALDCNSLAVVDCPIDYEENIRLLEAFKNG